MDFQMAQGKQHTTMGMFTRDISSMVRDKAVGRTCLTRFTVTKDNGVTTALLGRESYSAMGNSFLKGNSRTG